MIDEQEVWEKGHEIPNVNPDIWRKDDEGNIIRRDKRGSDDSDGWEVDHVTPKSKGGSDDIDNLRPLQS
ncbi:MAG: HNH endonuclease, partial [Boseongicola sp. SB0676_bin_33]|nr:HNH endonuclease [Boseongicola sp. SB0676_bin_33]